MRHLSRYFRLTPALNGPIDIPRATYVYTRATCVYKSVRACILSRPKRARLIFANTLSVLTYYIIASRSIVENTSTGGKRAILDDFKGGKKRSENFKSNFLIRLCIN